MSSHKMLVYSEMSGVVICQEQKQMFRKGKSKTKFHLNFSHSTLHQRDTQLLLVTRSVT